MRRRRNRRPIIWTPLLWTALIVNVIAALFYSRLTSIILVRVEGVAPDDRVRVQALLQRVHDQPALNLNRYAVESWMQERSAVANADLSRNIFGRARLRLTYRRPVAAVRGLNHAYLSREGVIFQTEGISGELPIVKLPPEAEQPILTIAGAWRAAEVGALCAAINDLGQGQRVEIAPSETGGLCLNIGSKFAVQLGLPDQLDAKVDYLRKQIEDDPSLIQSGRTLNLVSIERPSYKQGVDRIK